MIEDMVTQQIKIEPCRPEIANAQWRLRLLGSFTCATTNQISQVSQKHDDFGRPIDQRRNHGNLAIITGNQNNRGDELVKHEEFAVWWTEHVVHDVHKICRQRFVDVTHLKKEVANKGGKENEQEYQRSWQTQDLFRVHFEFHQWQGTRYENRSQRTTLCKSS